MNFRETVITEAEHIAERNAEAAAERDAQMLEYETRTTREQFEGHFGESADSAEGFHAWLDDVHLIRRVREFEYDTHTWWELVICNQCDMRLDGQIFNRSSLGEALKEGQRRYSDHICTPAEPADVEALAERMAAADHEARFRRASDRPAFARAGFAFNAGDADLGAEGLSVRDYLAAKAMSGILAGRLVPTPVEVVIESAFNHADAFLAESLKPRVVAEEAKEASA